MEILKEGNNCFKATIVLNCKNCNAKLKMGLNDMHRIEDAGLINLGRIFSFRCPCCYKENGNYVRKKDLTEEMKAEVKRSNKNIKFD